jgi:hypothetical protein
MRIGMCVTALEGRGALVRATMERAMALWKSEHSSAYGVAPHSAGQHLDLPVLIAFAAAPSLLLAWLVPLPLVLPALSVVSFTIAGCVALLAYHSGADRHADGITPWDVAGVFALIWVGAGMLSGPEHVVQLFDHITMALWQLNGQL